MFRFLTIILLVFSFNLEIYAKEQPKLLFYCGITMAKPMKEMAKIIEKKYNCKIKIIQGGSKDLYASLTYSKIGDLFLPGSDSYRKRYAKDGYLLGNEYIGFNQASIFVQKGNPKKIKNLNDLLRNDVATILCDPQSSSIGEMTENILRSFKNQDFLEQAYYQAVEIGTDSRSINTALIKKDVDMSINWMATSFWKENRKYIDTVKIDEKYAPKRKLVINLLKFSRYPEIAKKFMKFASSKEGQKIMRKYGFLGSF